MRELVFFEKGTLRWQEAPDPVLEGNGEALLRPLAVATCDLDLGIVQGAVPLQGPFAFGNEGIAEVIEVGSAVGSIARLP